VSIRQIPAQSYLHYKRKPDAAIGQRHGPTTYGGTMYVVTAPEWVEDLQAWEVGMSAVNPTPRQAQ
jgi:hypothetical protein